MIPDLGKYATDVLSAYAIALVLLIGLVALSLRQSVKARKALNDAERKSRK
nr:heme exporter protein CcmD [Amylibacter sp.]